MRPFWRTGLMLASLQVWATAAMVIQNKAVVASPNSLPGESSRAFFQRAQIADDLPTNLLLTAPPEWGRTVPGAAGTLSLHDPTSEGLILKVRLSGLLPRHRYLLTLNGNPKLPGNDLLPDPVPGLPEERYYDFYALTTDAQGAAGETFGLFLPSGNYAVRLYVKDTTDFKIVLYHDYFPCAVNPALKRGD